MSIQDQIPRSRITLTYRTTITGEPETVELPLRLLMMGDFSQVEERTDDLDTRAIRSLNKGGLDAVMDDMNLGISVTTPGLFEAEETTALRFRSMRDFGPDRIAQQVSSVNALRQMRTLLLELRSSIANQREFRKSLNSLITGDDLDAFITELNQNSFDAFKIPGLSSGDAGGEEKAPDAPSGDAAKDKSKDKSKDKASK